MKPAQQIELLTRARVMDSLSDAEVASVSTAETATALPEGAEYIDLSRLDRGVQQVDATRQSAPMGHVLPRKAIHEKTWAKILQQISAISTPSAN